MKAVYGTTTACYRKQLLPWELIFVLLTFRDAFDRNWRAGGGCSCLLCYSPSVSCPASGPRFELGSKAECFPHPKQHVQLMCDAK